MNQYAKAPVNPKLSLSDLLGRAYVDAVCQAGAYVQGVDKRALVEIAEDQVELFPPWYQQRLDDLIDHVGERVCDGLSHSARGAGTASFVRATDVRRAPLAGFGFMRIGENGKAYLTSKSEHYHLSLGHSFPGYRLVDHAQRLGIPNVTHNNTRGHATRLLEQELVRVLNGIPKGDKKGRQQVLHSTEPHVLNRVINLETGSLAVEAALKMMLARFYRLDETAERPKYGGRTPVLLVMADNAGGKKANYHGTTLLTQVMRGMWPEMYDILEASKALVVRPVRINDIEDFEHALAEYDSRPYKVAGFFHEIVLMNYGGVRLEEGYLQRAYALCQERDVPTCVDEIQSCIWSPELFLFREYGLRPDFVSVGKGFPGGQYPASRIVTTPAMDCLGQFGALVTNGQEELASIAYLVTMEFAQANRAYIRDIGDYYEAKLGALARRYATVIDRVEGRRHLSAIVFHSRDAASAFIAHLNEAGIDISAQTYKVEALPSALTKIPLISTWKMVDFLVGKMHKALQCL